MTEFNAQKIECEVTFLPRSVEGWGKTVVPIVNGNWYRPHLVVGDPNQRKPILGSITIPVEYADGSKSTRITEGAIEDYIGVAFDTGPENFALGDTINVKLTLMFWPGPQYDALLPGKTFTVREGGNIVGFGHVISPRFEEAINRTPMPGF